MTSKNGLPSPIAQRASQIYQDSLRSRLEPDHNGELLVLDVESGDYELDAVVASRAAEKLRRRRPQAVVFVMRVGFPTAFRLGAHAARPR